MEADLWRPHLVFPLLKGFSAWWADLGQEQREDHLKLNAMPRAILRASVLSGLSGCTRKTGAPCNILDIGAGDGVLARQEFVKRLRYVGTEPCKTLRDIAKRKHRLDLRPERLQDVRASDFRAMFPDRSVPIACTIISVIEHCVSGAGSNDNITFNEFKSEASTALENLGRQLLQLSEQPLAIVATLNQNFFLPHNPVQDHYVWPNEFFPRPAHLLSEHGWDLVFADANFHILDCFTPDLTVDVPLRTAIHKSCEAAGVRFRPEMPARVRDRGLSPFLFWLLKPRPQSEQKVVESVPTYFRKGAYSSVRTLSPGEILEHAGTIPSRTYFVVSGRLSLQRNRLENVELQDGKIVQQGDVRPSEDDADVDEKDDERDDTYEDVLFFEPGDLVPTFEYQRSGFTDRIGLHIGVPLKQDGFTVVAEGPMIHPETFQGDDPYTNAVSLAFAQVIRLLRDRAFRSADAGRSRGGKVRQLEPVHVCDCAEALLAYFNSPSKLLLTESHDDLTGQDDMDSDTYRHPNMIPIDKRFTRGRGDRPNKAVERAMLWLRAAGVIDFVGHSEIGKSGPSFVPHEKLQEKISQLLKGNFRDISNIGERLGYLLCSDKHANTLEKLISRRVAARSIRMLYGLANKNRDLYAYLPLDQMDIGEKPLPIERYVEHLRVIGEEAVCNHLVTAPSKLAWPDDS